MKVSDLAGELLDYWVERANGADLPSPREDEPFLPGDAEFRPSSRWSDGGPLIEREKICIVFDNGEWVAGTDASIGPGGDLDWNYGGFGDTALIAAMRAYVASKFGDDVFDGSAGQ